MANCCQIQQESLKNTYVWKSQTCEKVNAQKSRMQFSQSQALLSPFDSNGETVGGALSSSMEGQTTQYVNPQVGLTQPTFSAALLIAGPDYNQEHGIGGRKASPSCHLPRQNCSRGTLFAQLQSSACPEFWICSPLWCKKCPESHFSMGKWCCRGERRPFFPQDCHIYPS